MAADKIPYRNALRSKKLIREAFTTLLLDKNISDIKVKEIIDLANISKGTFYAHYGSIYGILDEIENEYIAMLIEIFKEFPPSIMIGDFLPMWIKSLTALEKDKIFFNVLLKSSFGDSFLKKIQTTFIDYLTSDQNSLTQVKSEIHARAYLRFAIGGSISLAKEWFDHPDDHAIESLATFINDSILHGLDSIKKVPSTP